MRTTIFNKVRYQSPCQGYSPLLSLTKYENQADIEGRHGTLLSINMENANFIVMLQLVINGAKAAIQHLHLLQYAVAMLFQHVSTLLAGR